MSPDLPPSFVSQILEATGASRVESAEVLQELWSGYGYILRLSLHGGNCQSVVAKYVRMPGADRHPRGWNSDLSHQRKVRSYEVESAFYADWARQCDQSCRVPRCLAHERNGEELLLVLEDLDLAGFPARVTRVEWGHVEACLRWLASFHAAFMGGVPTACGRLAPTGTWQLEAKNLRCLMIAP